MLVGRVLFGRLFGRLLRSAKSSWPTSASGNYRDARGEKGEG
jgi:hypothetical protein